MNISEASAFNRLCDFLGLGRHPKPQTVEQGREALRFLAQRSNQALSAGISPLEIEEATARLTTLSASVVEAEARASGPLVQGRLGPVELPEFPCRVQVTQTHGPNRWAEARERRPSSNPDRDPLVKVVYEGSRTSAWVTEPRVVYGA